LTPPRARAVAAPLAAHATPLLAGLGAGGRASRRRPPGLAPGTRRPGQQAAEPPDRLDQLGVAHVDLALLASGLGPLGELGLGLSPWLEEVYATAAFEAGPPRTQAPAREELRTVSVLAAEVAVEGPADPEERREVTGRCLAAVIAEVAALGGTVTSVSGGGLQAMFGAPEAHEDDPERAARAAFRALAAVAAIDGGTLRIGVETGPAVLGPIGGGARVEYGAVGEVVGQAAALQALARPGSALVGPVTRAAVGHLFAWGDEVPGSGT
jgi:class 3 adenylate cyclase